MGEVWEIEGFFGFKRGCLALSHSRIFASSFSRTSQSTGIILNLLQHFSSFIISSKAKLEMTDNELMPEVVVWPKAGGQKWRVVEWVVVPKNLWRWMVYFVVVWQPAVRWLNVKRNERRFSQTINKKAKKKIEQDCRKKSQNTRVGRGDAVKAQQWDKLPNT